MSTKANVGVIGKVREYHKELDSTNRYLHEQLQHHPLDDGHTVIAAYQSAGRGQQTNKWHATAGKNILLSFFIQPTFLDLERAFDLNRFVSLALRDMLSSFIPKENLWVKWPNDVYVGNRKIAGILIQNSLRGKSIASSIVGIGLNVNEENFPEHLAATSMIMEGMDQLDLEPLLEDLLSTLNTYYAMLMGKSEGLAEEYHSALYQKGTWSTYRIKGTTAAGKILGVDAKGFLELETSDGRRHLLMHGEISFL